MKNLTAAIIGCGAIYPLHADAIMEAPNVVLKAVVDIDEQKAKAAAAKYNCRYYTDYMEMLKDNDIDVVHICTPHYLHAPMAINGIKNHKHVLIEKPVAMNVEEAQEIVKVSSQYQRYAAVCFQNRYNKNSLKVKKILDSGTLGKIKGIKGIVTWHRNEPYYTESTWRGRWETEGGGVLINQAIHTLDLMQWFGGEIEAIKGSIDTRVLEGIIEVEDTSDATIYFKNGAVGVFYATNCFTTNSPVEIEIHCEKGSLRMSGTDLLIMQGERQELIKDVSDEPLKEKAYWGTSHKDLIHSFYEVILNEKSSDSADFITAQEGIMALRLIEGIYQSNQLKEKVKIAND